MPKYCKDCKHMRVINIEPVCVMGRKITDLVTGKERFPFAEVMRMESQPCGPDAKLFEPFTIIADADTDPPDKTVYDSDPDYKHQDAESRTLFIRKQGQQ